MSRPYSDEFLLSLNTLDPKRLGVQLAKKCISANLPARYVAQAFNVSRMTIHSWFRGQYIRDKNCTKIDNFMKLIDEEFQQGMLPVNTLKEAKKFIEEKVINKI